MTTSFAIKVNNKIKIETVAPTPIGAIVNWLVTHCRVMVRQGDSDDLIVKYFTNMTKRFEEGMVDIVEVEVSECKVINPATLTTRV